MSVRGNRNAMGRHIMRRYRNMTRERAEEIRALYFARTHTQRELGELFGLRQGSVSRIISGQTWA